MKKRHFAVVASALALGFWLFSGDAEQASVKDIYDRPWVSGVTKDPREAMHALFLSKQHKMGAAVVGSQYQHLVNVLGYQLKGDKLHLNFLQQEFKIAGKVKVEKCRGPGNLDLCLKINYRWKTVTLYSNSKWKRGQMPAHWNVDFDAYEDLDVDCPSCRPGQPHWLTGL